MKNIFSSRRNKNPHNKEETEKKEAPFFSKEGKAPFFNNVKGAPVQAKLTVGQPGDKYEKEADSMADAVVNKTATPEIQQKEISSIQRESLSTPIEDEKLGTAEQRMEKDKLIQEKPELQKMEGEEEESMVQRMEGEEEEGMINKMEEEEEEAVQTKSNGKSSAASSGLTHQIKSKSGKGRSLSKNTQAEMESSFKTDFSEVNIHTDQEAIKMNKELGAQAFTHGKDVYFNSGKYNPETTEGKRLLAHELTHVVQQNKTDKLNKFSSIQRKGIDNVDSNHDFLLNEYSKVSGIPRDEVTQHDPGYEMWLQDSIDQRPRININMQTPSKDPKPMHWKSMNQINAWELAKFEFRPQISYDVEKVIISGQKGSFVKSVDYSFASSNFEFFIANEIYQKANDKLIDRSLRGTWRRIYWRVKKHGKEHFTRYRQVVGVMENELIAYLRTLPSKKNPLMISKAELESYLFKYLTYFTAKLNHELWKTTCNWEKKDYPNLLKGINSVSGSFKPSCGPAPKVPKMPLLPLVIHSKVKKKAHSRKKGNRSK